MVARIGRGVLHVAPPSADELYTADEWQWAYTEATPEMKYAQVGSAPYVVAEFSTSDDQATYRVPSGPMSAAGKLFTRKTVLDGGMMSTAGATATGALNETPPSVEATIQMLLNVASRRHRRRPCSRWPRSEGRSGRSQVPHRRRCRRCRTQRSGHRRRRRSRRPIGSPR